MNHAEVKYFYVLFGGLLWCKYITMTRDHLPTHDTASISILTSILKCNCYICVHIFLHHARVVKLFPMLLSKDFCGEKYEDGRRVCRAAECAALELETNLHKVWSFSHRRPLLGPSPSWKRLIALGFGWHRILKLPVGYDLSVSVPIWRLLTTWVNACLV